MRDVRSRAAHLSSRLLDRQGVGGGCDAVRDVERRGDEQARVPPVGGAVRRRAATGRTSRRAGCRASAAAANGRTPRASVRDGWPSARRPARHLAPVPCGHTSTPGLSAPIAAMCRSHKNSAVRSPDGRPGCLQRRPIAELGALGLVGRRLVPLRPTGAHQQHVALSRAAIPAPRASPGCRRARSHRTRRTRSGRPCAARQRPTSHSTARPAMPRRAQ